MSTAFQEAARVVAEKGFQEGHAQALDALFPKGTLARADLEGMAALSRQAPEVAESIRGSTAHAEAPSLEKVREALNRFLAKGADEAQNAFRSAPKGFQELDFEVVHAGEGCEIRRYRSFAVATRRMPATAGGAWASVEGFGSLAGYLSGDNADEHVMNMTMPLEVHYSERDPSVQTMSVVVHEEDWAEDAAAPRPNDPSVQVMRIPERLVAVRPFLGVATEGEAKRQSEELLQALERSSSPYAPVAHDEYSVLQYNLPYTVPWRRRNEVAIVVAATHRPKAKAPKAKKRAT